MEEASFKPQAGLLPEGATRPAKQMMVNDISKNQMSPSDPALMMPNLLNITQKQLQQITIDSSDGGASEFYLDINENEVGGVAASQLKTQLANPNQANAINARHANGEDY